MRNMATSSINMRELIIFLLLLTICFEHIIAALEINTLKNGYNDMGIPIFEDVGPKNISTVEDDTILLKCCVRNVGNRTVSWIRKRDIHILTTTSYTYTTDQRFKLKHLPGSDDWNLEIKYVQQRDSGVYECQVNTEPKMNWAVNLEVTAKTDLKEKFFEPQYEDAKAARAKILGSTEVHVKRDSTISLACSVNIHALSVSWYLGSGIVDFDSVRGGISLETEKTDLGTTSRLMLTRASFKDSGNYTCVPAGAIPASVQVHVLNGEHPAAMQTSTAVSCFAYVTLVTLSLLATTTLHLAYKSSIKTSTRRYS